MNSFARKITTGLSLVLPLLIGSASAVAQELPSSRSDATSNPYNSPIKRANPNSRQGTVPSTPSVPGANTSPNVRPPTLENRGIGNDTRQPSERAPRQVMPPVTPKTDRPL